MRSVASSARSVTRQTEGEGYLVNTRSSQHSVPGQFIVIWQELPNGDIQLHVQEAVEYEKNRLRLEHANQVRKGKPKGKGSRSLQRQVEAAERRLRKACRERNVHLIHTFTLKGQLPAQATLDSIRARFCQRLTRDGIHPWVCIPEQGDTDRFHLHVILGQFYSFQRLKELWGVVAGELAGRFKFPREGDASGYVPGRAANYLIKEFARRHGQRGRVQCFFASKVRAGERKRRVRTQRTQVADSLGQALAGLLRQFRTAKIGYFNGNAKGKHASVIVRGNHDARRTENRDALAAYTRFITALRGRTTRLSP